MSTVQEISKANYIAELLQSYKPGFLPFPIFMEFARLFAMPVVEVVPVFEGKVLLVRRPPDDLIWPNMNHFPGTVIRSYDEYYDDAIERVCTDELNIPYKDSRYTLAYNTVTLSERGREVAAVYILYVDHVPDGFSAHNPTELPSDTIEHHMYMMKRLLRHHSELLTSNGSRRD